MEDPAAQLARMVADNDHLQRENAMLQAYLDQAEQAPAASYDSAKRKKQRKSGRDLGEAQQDARHTLTDEEKSDLGNQALEALQADVARVRAAGDKDLDDIATLLEEVELRIGDVKRATYEFRRDVIIGGEDARSAKTCAEKAVKFLEDHIHVKAVLVEKLTLKNATYKAAVAKLEASLAHKEEMGEVLHLVDFDQLKIENQQYMERIAAKNQELLQLKLSAGQAVQLLSRVKGRLGVLLADGATLRSQLAARRTEAGSLAGQCSAASRLSQAATLDLQLLQSSQKNVDQPQIMDYVKLKGQVVALQGAVADARRKLGVATGAAAAAGRATNTGAGGGAKRATGGSRPATVQRQLAAGQL